MTQENVSPQPQERPEPYAATEHARAQLLADVRDRLAGGAPGDALALAMRAMAAFAASSPADASALMAASMAGGARALDARDRGIGTIASLVEERYATAPGDERAPDVNPRIAIGGVHHLLARRLRHGEAVGKELSDGLARWVEPYARPLARHRWRGLSPVPLQRTSTTAPVLLRPSEPSSRSPAESATERERILFAAADIATERGYAAASVAEICARAGIDEAAFHRVFESREEVIEALHELFFQHLMMVTAGAFFTHTSWPEQIWRAGLAFTDAVDRDATLARVSFVEGQAAGAAAVRRWDELVSAFTIFLEQGFDRRGERDRLSASAFEPIAWTIFELAYSCSRTAGEPRLGDFLAHGAFVALAPVLGAQAADEFIDRRLRA